MTLKEIKEFLKGYMFTYKNSKYSGGSTIVDVEEDNDDYIIKGSSYLTRIKHNDIDSFLGFNNIKNGDESIELLQGSKRTQVKKEEKQENTYIIENVWRERWWQLFLALLQNGVRHECLIGTTNNLIQDAMKEMNNFFNKNKNNND